MWPFTISHFKWWNNEYCCAKSSLLYIFKFWSIFKWRSPFSNKCYPEVEILLRYSSQCFSLTSTDLRTSFCNSVEMTIGSNESVSNVLFVLMIHIHAYVRCRMIS